VARVNSSVDDLEAALEQFRKGAIFPRASIPV
jgi:hypothetical protein